MDADTRKELAAINRTVDFNNGLPAIDDASYNGVMLELQQAAVRADAIALQEEQGTIAERGAQARRKSLRGTIRKQVRHVLRVARLVEVTTPGIEGQFVFHNGRAANTKFLVGAQAVNAAAVSAKEQLLAAGMGDTFLDGFGSTLAQFDVETQAANDGRKTHVGSNAVLKATAAHCVALMKVLDGLNQVRFANDPQQLAAWNSASYVGATRRGSVAVEPEPAPVPSPQPVVVPPGPGPVSGQEVTG